MTDTRKHQHTIGVTQKSNERDQRRRQNELLRRPQPVFGFFVEQQQRQSTKEENKSGVRSHFVQWQTRRGHFSGEQKIIHLERQPKKAVGKF
ncbi:MAG: hypothetical protein C5B50_03550 [Verrucomicrobia bacterium]|nr:MAG: hypothetical protein C5B50_03550 [Verrucomicrobiota bacterium]